MGADSETVEVAAAVIEQEGLVLIGRRPAEAHMGGLWEFPGGKRRPDESFEDCLCREVREELGVGVEVGDLLVETAHSYPGRRVVLRFYRCRIRDGRPSPIGVTELRWVLPRDLGRHEFPPADEEVLRLLAGG